MQRTRAAALVIALGAGLPATLSGQERPNTAPPLRPGDVVEVTSWRERELAGAYPVDQDGNVVLPLLGIRAATAVASDDLRRSLLEEYRSKFRNETVQVILKRRVRVLGEVRDPGLYHVDPTMALGDVIALAGGITDAGDPDRIRIVRDGRVAAESGLDASLGMTILSGDQLLVARRGWLARYATVLIGVSASTLALLASTLL